MSPRPSVDGAVDGGALAVSVIIVNFNSGGHLSRCLECLALQTFESFEVVLVDNASGDDSLDRARAAIDTLGDRIVALHSDHNLGFAGGNNLGAAHARGRWLALLNPDAFADPDWLAQLVQGCERARAVMAGSLQLWEGHSGLLDGSGDAYHVSGIAWRGLRGKPERLAPPTGETFAPCAAAALYSAQVFRAVGGFDESFFAYHEDVDLAFRIRLIGGRAIQVQEARVGHVSSGLPGSASALAVRLGTRNRIWTYLKNMPEWLVLGLLPLHLLAVLVSLVRDARRGRGAAAIEGIGQALAGLGAVLRRRGEVQRSRRARIVDCMRAMTWSPFLIARGGADLRPWRQTAGDEIDVPLSSKPTVRQ